MALVLGLPGEAADGNVQESIAAADGLHGLSENSNGVARQLVLSTIGPGNTDIASTQ